MEEAYTISATLQAALTRFITHHNLHLLKENLRRLLIDFLDYGLETGMPLHFDHFFFPFNALLDVLDTATGEKQAFDTSQQQALPPAAVTPTPQQKVVNFLKAVLNPERIFLLHYAAPPGKRQHFDLLAVIPSTTTTSFSYYEQVLSMAHFEDITINVSLHKAEAIEQQLREGHIFYSLACNSNHLIYEKSL